MLQHAEHLGREYTHFYLRQAKNGSGDDDGADAAIRLRGGNGAGHGGQHTMAHGIAPLFAGDG